MARSVRATDLLICRVLFGIVLELRHPEHLPSPRVPVRMKIAATCSRRTARDIVHFLGLDLLARSVIVGFYRTAT